MGYESSGIGNAFEKILTVRFYSINAYPSSRWILAVDSLAQRVMDLLRERSREDRQIVGCL